MLENMRPLIFVLISALVIMPNIASAKRLPPPKVDPVDYDGVRYTVHVEGKRHCIQASDVKTGKALWEVTVYRTFLNPLMEEDVQWVFIKKMFIDRGALIVVAEDEQGYRVDVKSHAVKKVDHLRKNARSDANLPVILMDPEKS